MTQEKEQPRGRIITIDVGVAADTEVVSDDRIYIATSYANAATVESVVRPALEAIGFRIVSTWHEPPHHPENLAEMPTLRLLAAHFVNRSQIQKADAVLVLDSPGARETWAEVEYAIQRDIRVIYIGERPPPLSVAIAERAGMAVVAKKLDDFLAAVERVAADSTPKPEVRTDLAA